MTQWPKWGECGFILWQTLFQTSWTRSCLMIR